MTEYELNYIFDKTDGRCYHCRKKFACSNYGAIDAWGGWTLGSAAHFFYPEANPRAILNCLSISLRSSLDIAPSLRLIILCFIVLIIPVATDGHSNPACFQSFIRESHVNIRSVLLVIALMIVSCRYRWYASELIMTAGRCFTPVSSEKTKPTRTTSPRL